MLRPIRIIFISLVISLVLITSSTAGIILYGNIRENPNRANIDESDIFPARSYGFYNDVYDLKYDDSISFHDRTENIDKFKLSLVTDLNLISFDKKTGTTKFRLILKSFNVLSYTGKINLFLKLSGSYLKPEGFLKLADGSNPEFIIEGTIKMINEKATWTSFNRNKYFDIDVEYSNNYVTEHKYYIVKLKLLHDFPVIVTSKN